MNFRLKSRKIGDVPVVEIVGDFTGENIRKFTQKIETYKKGDCSKLVVDLSGTTFIDSHGLGVFIYSWRVMEDENRKLIFLNPQGFIRSMFQGTNLDKIFHVVDSEEQI